MGYVESVLRPGEQVVVHGKLHWIIFKKAILWTIISVVVLVYYWNGTLAAVMFIISGLFALEAWFNQWITEIAVTTRRVIYKKGFISRQTAEMNLSQVESVVVNQSILGRILNYGTIHIMGTGSGIEHIHEVSSPISLRNSILTK